MPISLDTMLALTARFHVSVDGVDLGGWARCNGLEVKFQPTTQQDGGNYQYETVLAGSIKYSNVTLQRAINSADTAKVLSWLRERASSWVDGHKSGGGGTAQIILFDARAKEVARWMLRNVYPDSWTGPDLDAGTLGVALEKLVLVHEGFL
jgi:phage tail-like protein